VDVVRIPNLPMERQPLPERPCDSSKEQC